MKLCASFQNHRCIETGVTVRKRSIRVKIGDFLSRVNLKFEGWSCKRIGHLFKLCPSFCSHWWIQTEVTVRKRPVWVKKKRFFSCVTLNFDGWPWKTIGHLSLATSSFLHHFIIICEFKLGLQSGKGLRWVLTSVTLTFDLDLLHGHHFCQW